MSLWLDEPHSFRSLSLPESDPREVFALIRSLLRFVVEEYESSRSGCSLALLNRVFGAKVRSLMMPECRMLLFVRLFSPLLVTQRIRASYWVLPQAILDAHSALLLMINRGDRDKLPEEYQNYFPSLTTEPLFNGSTYVPFETGGVPVSGGPLLSEKAILRMQMGIKNFLDKREIELGLKKDVTMNNSLTGS